MHVATIKMPLELVLMCGAGIDSILVMVVVSILGRPSNFCFCWQILLDTVDKTEDIVVVVAHC